ncbi:putative cilia-and flagella-associated protein [Plasmopara halstedii]
MLSRNSARSSAESRCNCIELTHDGGLVVSGWDDGKVRAFYPESVCKPSTSSASEWRLITGGNDGRVRVWRITSSRQTMEASLKEHRGPVNAIQVVQIVPLTFVRTQAMFASTVFRRVLYHPDESQLLTCGSDRRITYFDAYDGEAIRILEEAAESEMLAMHIEHSGTLFATDSCCWSGHSEAINAVKISPIERNHHCGSEGAIMIWEMVISYS